MNAGIAFFVLLFGVGCALVGAYVATLDEVGDQMQADRVAEDLDE